MTIMEMINRIVAGLILAGIILNLTAFVLTEQGEDASTVVIFCTIGGIAGVVGANLWH